MDLVLAPTGRGGVASVRASPTVVMEVLAHFQRRPAGQRRVIGALLGRTHRTGTARSTDAGGDAAAFDVEVCGSFAVPHVESDDGVAIDVDYFKRMAALTKRAHNTSGGGGGNAAESTPSATSALEPVGWYTTDDADDDNSVLVHEYFARECAPRRTGSGSSNGGVASIVCLLVRPGVPSDSSSSALPSGRAADATAHAFTGASGAIGAQTLSTYMVPVACRVQVSDAEGVALDALARLSVLTSNSGGGEGDSPAAADGRQTKQQQRQQAAILSSELVNFERSMNALLSSIDTALEYVDDVVSGDDRGDPRIGRFLTDTLAAVPKVDSAEFETLFTNSVKDLLMVIYLGKLASTNLTLSERLLTLGN